MYVNKSKMMLALGAVNVKIKIWAVLCGMSLMAFAGSFLPEMKEKYGIGPSTFVWPTDSVMCSKMILTEL